MKALIRQPALHFILIGLFLFFYQGYREENALREMEALDSDTVQRLQDDFIRQTGRLPTPEHMELLIRQELDSRMLYAEALRRNFHRDDQVVLQRLLRDADFLGLEGNDEEKIRAAIELGVHESDEVIRRRMIQRMEKHAQTSTDAPTDNELKKLYEEEQARWLVPARYTFQQVFFSADRDGFPEQRAERHLTELRGEADVTEAGDPFLHGRQFAARSLQDMTYMFGAAFSDAMDAAGPPLGEWFGPVPSAYGAHLVRVEDVQPARQRSFDEVKPKLVAIWREQEQRIQLQNYLAELRKRYVVVEGRDS
ncbi:hypothetical protein FHR99_000407 [Litorivivens lipolytica]|uniref:peptidylprolyl isomerase n=1 Tax=Litorivivens lipolytica TaxID=1524264 RepID=A0A7W4Z5N5_9GAMM|nr:peptidylprolyl isomerase [Litorivivens lipolytica]MBB3046171.1 hypothetical protein [Litorivivens lipolytica]